MRQKGIAVKIQDLILVVIGIMIIVTVLSYLIAPTVADLRNSWEELWGSTSSIDAIRFKNAVKCAYYRCAIGCDSREVKEIDNIAPNPENPLENVGCYDFCEKGRKICGLTDNTKPIDVKINKNMYVKKNWFKDFTNCMGIKDESEIIFDPMRAIIGRWEDFRFLAFENADDFESVKEDCDIGKYVVKGALLSITLKPGTYGVKMATAGEEGKNFERIYVTLE